MASGHAQEKAYGMWRVVPVLAIAVLAGSAAQRQSGSILFSRNGDVYAIGVAGGRAHVLVRDASAPAVSRDGRSVAFVRGGEIWTATPSGAHARQLTTRPPGLGNANEPAWSRDGRTLYFDRMDAPGNYGRPALAAVQVTGATERRLTRGCDFAPAPSPAGSVVAYTTILGVRDLDCAEGNDPAILAVGPTGRAMRLPFRFPDLWTYDAAWSPDGRRLAYGTLDPESGIARVYISKSDGSQPRRLEAPRGDASSPVWSPDGRKIVLVVKGRLWLVAPDGGGARALGVEGADPVWLPPAR